MVVVVALGSAVLDVALINLPRLVVLAGLGPVNAVVGGYGAGGVPGDR